MAAAGSAKTLGAVRVLGSALFSAGAIIRARPLMGALCITATPIALPAAGNPRLEPLRWPYDPGGSTGVSLRSRDCDGQVRHWLPLLRRRAARFALRVYQASTDFSNSDANFGENRQSRIKSVRPNRDGGRGLRRAAHRQFPRRAAQGRTEGTDLPDRAYRAGPDQRQTRQARHARAGGR